MELHAAPLQRREDAWIEMNRRVAEEGGATMAPEAVQYDGEQLRIRLGWIGRAAENALGVEFVREAHGEPGRCGLVTLHRIHDQHRLAPGPLDGVAPGDLGAAGE